MPSETLGGWNLRGSPHRCRLTRTGRRKLIDPETQGIFSGSRRRGPTRLATTGSHPARVEDGVCRALRLPGINRCQATGAPPSRSSSASLQSRRSATGRKRSAPSGRLPASSGSWRASAFLPPDCVLGNLHRRRMTVRSRCIEDMAWADVRSADLPRVCSRRRRVRPNFHCARVTIMLGRPGYAGGFFSQPAVWEGGHGTLRPHGQESDVQREISRLAGKNCYARRSCC